MGRDRRADAGLLFFGVVVVPVNRLVHEIRRYKLEGFKVGKATKADLGDLVQHEDRWPEDQRHDLDKTPLTEFHGGKWTSSNAESGMLT